MVGLGTAQGSLGHLYGTDASYVLGLSVQYPYAEYAVRKELAQVGATPNLGEPSGQTAHGSRYLKQRAQMPSIGGSSSRPMRLEV